MKVEIFGTECQNCEKTLNLAKQVAQDIGINAEISKVTDLAAMAAHGVMQTPALVVDGKLVHAGSVPTEGQMRLWLTKARPGDDGSDASDDGGCCGGGCGGGCGCDGGDGGCC